MDNAITRNAKRTRAAKIDGGKTEHIENMSFSEWEKRYVKDKGLANSAENDIIELTDDEHYAINSYISSESYVLNEKLRNGIKLTTAEEKLVVDLESALDKMPRYNGNLNRSISFKNDKELAEFVEKHNIGDIITYDAFTSTTKDGIYNNNANVQIYIENAESGADISTFNLTEQ